MEVNQLFAVGFGGFYRCVKVDKENVYAVLVKPYGNSWVHHLEHSFIKAPTLYCFDKTIVPTDGTGSQLARNLLSLYGSEEEVSFLLDTNFEDLLSNEKNKGWDALSKLGHVPFIWLCENPELYPDQVKHWEDKTDTEDYHKRKFKEVQAILIKE